MEIPKRNFKGKMETRKYIKFPKKGKEVKLAKALKRLGDVLDERPAKSATNGEIYIGTAYYIRNEYCDIILEEAVGKFTSLVGIIVQGCKKNVDKMEDELRKYKLKRTE